MSTLDTVELLSDWPQPASGVPEPIIRYGPGPLKIAYETADGHIAVVAIPLCLQLICGHPNDEALQGHLLYDKGLKFYAVHRVGNSSRLAALERANSVHSKHDPLSYLKDKEHWVLTFQDCTVECLLMAIEGSLPSFTVCDSWDLANQLVSSGRV